ncbi:glycosyltransferase [Sinisalibacter aestuarii]|nr:glycosyltransferase [Sinisalibacter aestuarii]
MIDGLGRGGAEHLLTIYAPELQRQGFDMRVVALKDWGESPVAGRLRAAGIAVERLPLAKLRNIGQIRAAMKRLREIGPDVIHAHLEASTVLAGLARIALRVPVVSTLHTLEYPERFNRAGARLWLRDRLLANIFDRVICLSPAIADEARRHGLARAPVVSIANGIDLGAFDANRGKPPEEIRAGLGIPPAARVIVTVAVLRPPKGIDRLIRAMADLVPVQPDLHLLIVGEGEERARLEALTAELGLDHAVTFAGFRSDVADVLRVAELFVLPTLWDALPTVLIEAMAADLPIVASNVGGIPDMVRDGTDGILVPKDDVPALTGAIGAIMGDEAHRQEMARAARERVEAEFSLPIQVGKLADLYRELSKDDGR